MRNGEDLSARDLDAAEEAIGYRFRDRELLKVSLTHKSYSNSFGGKNNERMEFLGDAVLEFCVTDRLFRTHSAAEGELTELRQRLVSQAALERAAQRVGLFSFMRYSGGKQNLGGKTASNLFEAVLAAIYLDGGIGEAAAFLDRCLSLVDSENFKTLLQEYTQKRGEGMPDYRTRESGQGYACTVCAMGECGEGYGESKKTAETEAAKQLWNKLKKRTGN